MKKKNKGNNIEFTDSLILNNATYIDYLERLKKVALSMFEWVNLPSSMNEEFLEKCLYYNGQASLLYDKKYGFINTRCCDNGEINIYDLPTKLHCFSQNYSEYRNLYVGLNSKENQKENQCILVRNDIDRTPTQSTIELFAFRLYQAERTCDINIIAQRTPVIILCDEKQRLLMQNLFEKYDGFTPYIFGDKDQLNSDMIKAIRTDAPFVADKIMDLKKQIWNEALTFLGINNIIEEKKERLVADEVNSNNELINLNLQSYLAPRKKACKQFNELFGFKGTEKEIDVRVRSDLHNIIKQAESIVNDYKSLENNEELKENEV